MFCVEVGDYEIQTFTLALVITRATKSQ